MSTNQTIDRLFVLPLLNLYRLDAPSPDDYLATLRRELADATDYQLEQGAAKIIRSRTHKTFPAIGECVQAVESSPRRAPTEAPDTRTAARPAIDRAPALIAAERWLARYDEAGPEERERMEREQPGRLAACRLVVETWARWDRPAAE